MDSISIVSRNALISSWNRAGGLEPIEKPSDIAAYEGALIELELFQLEEPDEHPIEVSYDENEPNPPKINLKNSIEPQLHVFWPK